MADKIAVAFEIVDHGIESSQYFQGCGTTFTDYTDVATGIGDDFKEALDDALESLAQAGWNVDIVVPDEDMGRDGDSVSGRQEQEYEQEKGWKDDEDDNDDDDDDEGFDEMFDGDERHYHVSVRVREYDPEKDEKYMEKVGKAIGRLAELAIEIHNAQTPSGDASKLPGLRKERRKLENYLSRREIALNDDESRLKR